MEGACGAAISHLQKECFVVVEDINSAEIQSLRERALAAESFAVDGGREDNEAMRTAYANFSLEGRRLCKDYSDVFPAGIIGFERTSSAPDDGKAYYDGLRPPEWQCVCTWT
ncbi:unnamed protein product [Urochloa decumbens]|uniref:Uncharacterized protein n=1 Tax=Urochloa decumbens TaxID=240449 RepID=A0ABC9BJF1_9POAL